MRARTRGRWSSVGTARLSSCASRRTPADANVPTLLRRRRLEMAESIEAPPAEGHALNQRQSLARSRQPGRDNAEWYLAGLGTEYASPTGDHVESPDTGFGAAKRTS